jgi:hypothetical protein
MNFTVAVDPAVAGVSRMQYVPSTNKTLVPTGMPGVALSIKARSPGWTLGKPDVALSTCEPLVTVTLATDLTLASTMTTAVGGTPVVVVSARTLVMLEPTIGDSVKTGVWFAAGKGMMFSYRKK